MKAKGPTTNDDVEKEPLTFCYSIFRSRMKLADIIYCETDYSPDPNSDVYGSVPWVSVGWLEAEQVELLSGSMVELDRIALPDHANTIHASLETEHLTSSK